MAIITTATACLDIGGGLVDRHRGEPFFFITTMAVVMSATDVLLYLIVFGPPLLKEKKLFFFLSPENLSTNFNHPYNHNISNIDQNMTKIL